MYVVLSTGVVVVCRSVNKGEHRHVYILQVYKKEESASLHRIDFDMYICTLAPLGKTVGTPYPLHYISQHGRSQNIWTLADPFLSLIYTQLFRSCARFRAS